MRRYFDAIQNYFNFRGRASRADYWFFVLFNFLVSILVMFVDVAVFGLEAMAEEGAFPLFSVLYSLFIIIPRFSLSVRRLHDTGRSGFWLLINLIPILGQITFFIFTVLPSDLNPNRWGPPPASRRKQQAAYSY
ncbi:MAG: DUF805 domain-containing protein [Chloroflexota bacterium]